jgi:hypothetical protein
MTTGSQHHNPTTEEITSTRQIALRSGVLASISIIMVVTAWWLKGFRLRVIGDAAAMTGLCNAGITSYPLDRMGFLIPYCFTVEVAGVRPWLIIQILLWSIAVVALYRAGSILFDETTGFLAGLGIALTWETFRFAVRPQTDLMLLFAVALCFWALARYYHSETRKNMILVVGVVTLALISRPLSIPIVFGWIIWKMSEYRAEFSVNPRKMSRRVMGLTIGALGVGLFTIQRFFVQRLLRPAPTASINWRQGLAGSWYHGIIVTHPGEPTIQYLYQPEPAGQMLKWMLLNIEHIVVMGLMRMAAFFIPLLPRWSTFHIVVNAVTILPFIIGTFLGARHLIKNGKTRIAGLLLAPIVGSLITVAIIFVDGGFNYRAPATLSFVLLTAYWCREMLASTGLEDRLQQLLPYV